MCLHKGDREEYDINQISLNYSTQMIQYNDFNNNNNESFCFTSSLGVRWKNLRIQAVRRTRDIVWPALRLFCSYQMTISCRILPKR